MTASPMSSNGRWRSLSRAWSTLLSPLRTCSSSSLMPGMFMPTPSMKITQPCHCFRNLLFTDVPECQPEITLKSGSEYLTGKSDEPCFIDQLFCGLTTGQAVEGVAHPAEKRAAGNKRERVAGECELFAEQVMTTCHHPAVLPDP